MSRPAWAGCLSMIHKRHPTVSTALVRELEEQPETLFLRAASRCHRELTSGMEFVPPSVGGSGFGVPQIEVVARSKHASRRWVPSGLARTHFILDTSIDQVQGRRGHHCDPDQQGDDHPVPLVQSGGAVSSCQVMWPST